MPAITLAQLRQSIGGGQTVNVGVQTIGNYNIVVINSYDKTTIVTGVTDTIGTNYTKIYGQFSSNDNSTTDWVVFISDPIASTTSNTVTVATNQSPTLFGVSVYELNIASGGVLTFDSGASDHAVISGTAISLTSPSSSVDADSFAVAMENPSGFTTVVIGSPFTSDGDPSAAGGSIGHQIVSVSTVFNPTWTTDGGEANAVLAVFGAHLSGGTPGFVPYMRNAGGGFGMGF